MALIIKANMPAETVKAAMLKLVIGSYHAMLTGDNAITKIKAVEDRMRALCVSPPFASHGPHVPCQRPLRHFPIKQFTSAAIYYRFWPDTILAAA